MTKNEAKQIPKRDKIYRCLWNMQCCQITKVVIDDEFMRLTIKENCTLCYLKGQSCKAIFYEKWMI